MTREVAEALINNSAMDRDLTREALDELMPELTDEEFEEMWANRPERVVLQ